ncbi:MAG: UDP-N-acetylmuramoyl-tripeptide--D-alanyl-D-alanine ligase [Desulfuromonadales bacterium]|nr:UDP-N-acetylmuramoyl-tripeptide--D-alanyl-D-alanine ligase [Desulfuromonadales bacterium]
MIRMTLREVADAVGGHLIRNGASLPIEGISTDSRTLQPGELFVPLRGEHYDGHEFLGQAASHGAVACLSEQAIGGLTIPVIQVKDTLRALGDLASRVRQSLAGPLVAITGSSGKTTCKEMLSAILARTAPGLKSLGNFNNLVGVPLSLFPLRDDHRWAVIEMGMSARGEIARLTEIAAPQIGIITNVGAAHLESLGGISGVAVAKGELYIHLPPGGVAIINADDPEVRQLPVANGVSRRSFGLAASADVRAEAIEADNGTVRFMLCCEGSRTAVSLPLPGRHNVANALAAVAAARVLDVPLAEIVAGLESFRPCPGRMELIELAEDIVILDDTYNANPLSVRAALDALHDLGRPGQRIAVLGDMLELGVSARELHEEIGQVAAGQVDRLLTCGPQARAIADGARLAGFDPQKVASFTSHAELVETLAALLSPGDRVLVKGSRGMRMEQVISLLCAGMQGRAALDG